MVLPKSGTMVVLFGDPKWVGGVAEEHGWLFKYRFYDINPDMVHLISVATGSTVYMTLDAFMMWFKELADVGTTERAA